MIQLKIGTITILIEGLEKTQIPINSLLFLCNNECIDLHYCIKIGTFVTSVPKTILYQKDDIVVYRNNNNLESRLLILHEEKIPYAYYDEIDEKHINIYLNPDFLDMLRIDTIFYSLLALERHLMIINAYVYHCAYMDFDGKAILFSGPSGMGKSTQSNLWCKVFPDHSKVLNGDKCLLLKENGKYYAVGWPICGSSGICYNERREVSAIILLQQALTNYEVPERRIQQFKRILEQLAVNYWNAPFVNNAMTFAEELICSVPCCTYACNMQDDAVTKLYTILQNKFNEKN